MKWIYLYFFFIYNWIFGGCHFFLYSRLSTRLILHLQYFLITLWAYSRQEHPREYIVYSVYNEGTTKGGPTSSCTSPPFKWLPSSAVAHLPLVPTPGLTFASSFLRSSSIELCPTLILLPESFLRSAVTLSYLYLSLSQISFLSLFYSTLGWWTDRTVATASRTRVQPSPKCGEP